MTANVTGSPGRPSWGAVGWRDVDWDAVARDVVVRGRRVRVVDTGHDGDGRDVLVLLHGVSASWRWFIEIIPDLARSHRVVAVDLPGFGGSGFAPGRAGFSGLATAVADVLSALGVERAAVLGHSMGSIVATRLAIERPALVTSLIITGGPILSLTGLARRPWHTLRTHPRPVVTLLGELLTVGVPVPSPIARRIAHSPTMLKLALGPFLVEPGRLDPELMEHVMAALGAPGTFPALLSTVITGDPADGLETITCPVHIIRGPKDPLSPPGDVDRFLAAVPTAKAVDVAGAGHWPHIEQPSAFLTELDRFLRGRHEKAAGTPVH